MIKALTTLAALATATLTSAQDLTPKAPPAVKTWVYGAMLYTLTDDPYQGAVQFNEEGQIGSVLDQDKWDDLPASQLEGHVLVDATGLHLYPGFIGANTQMGLIEIGAVRATRDMDEAGDVSPEVYAAISVNPDSTVIPVTRSNGVLTVNVLPLGGIVPGRASLMRMDGWTHEDMTIAEESGLVVNWPVRWVNSAWWSDTPPEDQKKQVDERRARIDEIFETATSYLAARAADATIPEDLRWEAMSKAINGERPVFIRANSLESITSAVTWATSRGLDPIIVGGRDAGMATDLLLQHDVPVVITGTHRLPGRRDADYDSIFKLPQVLEAAGVTWCMAGEGGSFETPHERLLPYHVASSIGYGLDETIALKSVTIYAANILGIGDTHGTIESDKQATFFLSDGDPLEVMSTVTHAWIDGRKINLTDKQKKLNEKYREKYQQLRDAGEL
ncbi:MAG: hypothetical protein AAGD00_09425 [Planctomycetota bacterium]